MAEPQPATTKAGVLFALGSVSALLGLLLAGGRSLGGESLSAHASPALARFMEWAPTTLLAAGGTLAALGAAVVGMAWFQKKA